MVGETKFYSPPLLVKAGMIEAPESNRDNPELCDAWDGKIALVQLWCRVV